jgi:hypothetical protein
MDGDDVVTVTHPFHPLSGQQFPLLAHRFSWGEPRVFFLDPQTHQVRSLPAVWTDQVPLDSFVRQAAGRAILRLTDLQALVQLLHDLHDPSQEVPS